MEPLQTPSQTPTEDRHITLVAKPGCLSDFDLQPWCRFGGKYLKKYGFSVGQKVTVHLEPGKITLTIDEAQTTTDQTALETKIKKDRLTMQEIAYRLMLTHEAQANLSDDKTPPKSKSRYPKK